MKYISVKQAAELWSLSERSVRNYCSQGRIEGAFLTGKTWNIPEKATRPTRAVTAKKAPSTLAEILTDEMQSGRKGGIYHKIQVELTYNSNHIEGSRLTADQTRYIFETNTIGVLKDETINVDDIIETSNHFRCIDLIIENRSKKLSEAFIKELHRVLKSGTSDSRKAWFEVGDYKRQPNDYYAPQERPRGNTQAPFGLRKRCAENPRGYRGIPREIRPVPGRKRPRRAAHYVQGVPAVWRHAVHHRGEH